MLYVWPLIDLPLDELSEVARRLVPLTDGLGLEQVVVSGRFAGLGPEPVERVVRLAYEPGRGLTVRITEPPTAPMQPLDDYTRKLIQTRRRGLVYPYELVPLLSGERGTFVEHDLDGDADGASDGTLVPVDRPAGMNRAGVVVGVVRTPTARYPEGMTRVVVLGDPTRAMGSITEAECRRVLGAIDLAEQLDVPDRVVRALGRGEDRHGLRQREPRLGGPGAAPARRAHPAGRRGQRRRGRHQRRRPAVLERRGDDAHAHPWHPRHDAGQRHGADRQAGHRLLGRGVGRGQPRHRRLRPGDGAERRGAVLGAEPGRGVRDAPRPLRADLPRSGRALAPTGRDHRPARPGRALEPAPRRRHRLRDGRRHLLAHGQPGPQEAVRHPHADGRRRRPGSSRRSSAGRRWPRPRRRSSTTPASAATR